MPSGVGQERLAGLDPAAADVGRAGQVVDGLGLGRDDGVGQRVGVGDVDAVDVALELDDVVTLFFEVTDEVNTDEAPSSGDQRSHGRTS